MADDGGGNFRSHDYFDVSQVILIQSYIRGALARKWMRELRQAYLDVVVSIERTSPIDVAWEQDFLCHPQVVKGQQALKVRAERETKKKKKKSDLRASSKPHLSAQPTPDNTKDAQVSTSGLNFYTSGQVPYDLKSNSVEIQTSFIDSPLHTIIKHFPQKDIKHSDSRDLAHDNDKILDNLDTSWKDRVEPFLKNNFDEHSEKDSASHSERNSETDLRLQLDSARESELSLKSPDSRVSLDSERSGPSKDRPDEILNRHGDNEKRNDRKYKRCVENGKHYVNGDDLEIRSVNSERSDRSDRSVRSGGSEKNEVESIHSYRSENSQQSLRDGSTRSDNGRNSGDKVANRSEGKHRRNVQEPNVNISERHLGRKENHFQDDVNDFNERHISERSSGKRLSDRLNERQYSERSEEKHHSDRSETSSRNRRNSGERNREDGRLTDKGHRGEQDVGRSSQRSRKSSREWPDSVRSEKSNKTREPLKSLERLDSDRSEKSNRSRESLKSKERYEDRRVATDGNNDERRARSRSRDRNGDSVDKKSDRDGETREQRRSSSRDRHEEKYELEQGQRSHRSDRSTSERSRSARSDRSEGQRSRRRDDRMSPRHSARSPIPSGTDRAVTKRPTVDARPADIVGHQQRDSVNSTTLTNVTSVWDSFNSVRESHEPKLIQPLPQDTQQLKEIRKNVSMELLWIQQAIDSRKNYLRLKGKM